MIEEPKRDEEEEEPGASDEDLLADAEVVPLLFVKDKKAAAEAAEGGEVTTRPYDPAETREKMRVKLGLAVIVGTLVAAAVGAVSALAGGSETDKIMSGIFTPLLGLAGAVIGFYFGGKDSSA